LQEGEDSTGLLNTAGVHGNFVSDWSEVCEEIPNPKVEIAKTIVSGPIATGPNSYTIKYNIAISNTSGDLATYELRDTLKYGLGTGITGLTDEYGGGEGQNSTIRGAFNGQTDYVITTGENLAANSSESYTVDVTFEVDRTKLTDNSVDCELQEGEDSTGLLNTAGVHGNFVSDWSEVCEEIPNPKVEIAKTIVSGPIATGPNSYTIKYNIAISNTSGDLATYELRDTLKYGLGTNITGLTDEYGGGEGQNSTIRGAFNGQTDYVITTGENLAANSSESYTVDVTFEVDRTKLTDNSVDCELQEGEDSTGLLNTAGVHGNFVSDWSEVCEEIPNPKVEIAKTIVSGPIATGPNSYTIKYNIAISNTSGDLATYELRDTLKYGLGTNITGLTDEYGGGEGQNSTIRGAFNGQTDYVITTGENLAANSSESYTVDVTFEVDRTKLTDNSVDCELQEGEDSTGLLNTAGVHGNFVSDWSEVCEEIPNPKVEIAKTIVSGPIATGPNSYTIKYNIAISNTSGDLATYELRDTLKYGLGTNITGLTVVYGGGEGQNSTIRGAFNGQTDYVITTGENLAANSSESYTVDVTFEVDRTKLTDNSVDCELQEGEDSTGLLNTAGVHGNFVSDWSEVCEEIPNPKVEIAKTIV